MVIGGGKAEAEASNIRIVADHRPVVVQDGIALPATAFRRLDRQVVGLGDGGTLPISRGEVPSGPNCRFPQPGDGVRRPADPWSRLRPEHLARHGARLASFDA